MCFHNTNEIHHVNCVAKATLFSKKCLLRVKLGSWNAHRSSPHFECFSADDNSSLTDMTGSTFTHSWTRLNLSQLI